MSVRRTFKIDIKLNGRRIKYLVIDPHYELRHSESISDFILISLVGQLNGGDFVPKSINGDFEYYMTEDLYLNKKEYRLIWLLQKDQIYIGVVNAYRR